MKRLFVLLAGLLSASFIVARAQTPPTLAIQAVAPQMLRIGWPNTALGFGLESSSSPTASSPWQPVIQTPTDQNNQFSVLMNVGQGNQFFRLRLPPFTTIREISPVDGETGVAVIRETIVHLTAPLASNAVVTTDNFYAGYGGRKLLSRVELSTDRRKATLFYLEPLPGSTRINAIFNGTGLIDELGRPLDPDGDGVAGGLAVIAFDTLNVTPLTGTAVVGTVFASELIPGPDTGTNAINRPLEGVIITVDGMEETLRTTTDAQGKFTLAPAPPGRFFVKIDGRMANGSQWPKNGAYYPYVGKAWDAVAGKTNNLAGGTGQIFLPLISADTLQPVSMTVDTTISFPSSVISNNPALAGVSITIPANSLFSDDGTRGGKVGIAPVPPDRLPGPLPPGLQPPIIITVQTDGPLNFDKPAPVCFPNLPDTTTGKPWPPGTQGGLISFNHKKGVWEPVGGMTVSADGKYFCTDPGVGIIQPGWHGVGCPKPDGPGPDPDPYPDEPCKPDPNEVEQCFKGCDAEYRRCRIVGNIDKRREISDCFIAASTADERRACANKLWANGNDEETRCKEERTACEEPCRTCSASKFSLRREATEGTRLKSAALSTLDRVLGLVEEAFDLLRPDLAARNDPPDSVLQQVKAKLALADEIAGGNAEALMIEAAASVERELDSFHTGAGRSAEEFPGYPVLFAAEIERKGSTFWIRGKTEPFGRYWLYVPPDGQLRSIRFYDPSTRRHDRVFPNSDPFARYALPNFRLRSLDSGVLDSDSDGLPDGVEYVYGTDPIKVDTDGDGIPDGAEVQQGTDPLGGLIVQTGVIATVKTPSSAVDVAAEGGLIVTAEGNSGISIFSKYNGDNPTILAHVVTHGPAQRVAFGDKLIAVAEGDSGLEIIDITDPATARITRQVPLPFESTVSAVAVVGRIAYVGLGAGTVVAVDVTTGRQLKHLSLSEEVVDLVIADDYLYALTRGQIYVVSIRGGDLTLAGTAASPSPAGPNRRLFVGGGIGYALDRNGYNTLDLTDPANPVLIQIGQSGQFGWRQMVVNGSGLALAAVGPNSTDDGPHDVSLYDTSSPTNAVSVITTLPTPGIAQAIAIWDGLAYVADDTAGLQVINYLAYDSKGVAPKITLSANFPLVPAQVVEGASARITANATDDVQVRNVELYIDGALVQTDGSFPFEFRFIVPQLAVGKSSFSVRAKATDTGGNSAWSDEISVNLLPDTTPPQVTRISPHSIAAGAKSVSVSFDEEIDATSLTASALKLFASGPDGVIGTSDDVELTGGTRAVQSDRSGATLSFGGNLPLGTYRIVVGRDFTDRRGNHLSAEVTQELRVVDAVYWINPQGGDWSDPQNWSTGRLPEPTDDVLISTSDPATIMYSKGNSSIHTLFGENSFVLSGGRLEIAQTIQVSRFELKGGTLALAHILGSDTDGADLRLKSGVLDGVTLDADATLENQAFFTVINGLTVNRMLTMNGHQNYAQLRFQGAQTLGGAGQLVFGSTDARNYLVPDAALTIGSGFTIHGASGFVGQAGAGADVPVINQGTISADVAGGIITIHGNPFTNTGTVETKNGGLVAFDSAWNNTGIFKVMDGIFNLGGSFSTAGIGTIQRSGGVVNLVGLLDNTNSIFALNPAIGSWVLAGGTVRSGSITSAGGASLRLKLGTLDGVTLDSDLTMENQDNVIVRNGLTINRSLTMEGHPNFAQLTFQGAQTLGGAGQLVFGGTDSVNYLSPEAALTIGSGFTIHGASGIVRDSAVPVMNRGTISADVAGGTITIHGNPFTNTGTVETRNGGLLAIDTAWNNKGIFKITDGIFNLGGSFTTADIGAIERSGGVVNLVGLLDNTNATLALNPAIGSWVLAGGTVRSGSITSAGGATLRLKSGTLDGVTLDTDLTMENQDDVIVLNGLTINRTLTMEGHPNFAQLSFQGAQTLGGVGQLVFGGTNSLNYLSKNAALTIGSGFTIHGASGFVGQIVPVVPLINQGTISADVAGGTIIIHGDPFTNNGTTNELNGGRLVINP